MEEFDHEDFRRRLEEKIHRRVERSAQRWGARRSRGPRHSGSGGVVIGVILAGIGVLLLLQNLGILYIDDLWRYWPVIMIVVGFSRIVTACGMGGRIWGVVVGLAGVVFLLDNLNIIRGNVWNYVWPVVLITLGLGMLARSMDRRNRWDWWNPAPPTDPKPAAASGTPSGSAFGSVAGSGTGSLQNTLSEWAFFGGVRRRIDAQDFEGGDALAICGGIRIDLDRAGTKKEEIRIEANAIFGGIDIRLPDTWAVTVRGTGVFGGYEDKTIDPRPGDAKPPHIIITGVALFGGVTVKN